MNFLREGGYITQQLGRGSSLLSTERNTMHFMFLTKDKDGVLFYMGKNKDHLLVELVNGSLRAQANFGGGKVSPNHLFGPKSRREGTESVT